MRLSVTINAPALGISIDPQIIRDHSDTPAYQGEYEATPTRETQVFDTRGKRMTANFTVNPIPPNYGLVTWDWRVLTIS